MLLRVWIGCVSGAVLLMLAAGPALADAQQSALFGRWKSDDACAKNAAQHHPDHDQASLEQRDAEAAACRKLHNLPPRPPMAPTTAGPAAAAPAPVSPATTAPDPSPH